MGLKASLARLAARRLHVLLLEVPGAAAVRWAAEDEVLRRGWVFAGSVADADLLLVCGNADSALAELAESTTTLMPRPAGREDAAEPAEVVDALDRAAAQWCRDGLRAQGQEPSSPSTSDPSSDPEDKPPGEHDQHDMHDMHDMHSQHEHMHGMDMTGPGGLPLASGASDRDGLEMDVLHVPLGPVLPAWPAGLLLTCTLAGDVVTGVGVQVLAPMADVVAAPPGGAVRADLVAGALQLAGREDLAARARRARGLLLAGQVPAANGEWARVHSAVRRSRMLRWSLRGVGVLDPVLLADHRLPENLVGDVGDRLDAMLSDRLNGGADAGDGTGARWPGSAAAGWRSRLLGLLPALVTGQEVAAVRLLLAGLPLDVRAGLEVVRETAPEAATGG